MFYKEADLDDPLGVIEDQRQRESQARIREFLDISEDDATMRSLRLCGFPDFDALDRWLKARQAFSCRIAE